jgi:Mg/Co/Ni transporter MgtE
MKSAWELALERSDGSLNELSDEKKTQIAEIDSKRQAKLAEIEITYEPKLKTATTVEELQQLKDDMAVEQASARSQAENKKKEVRNS